VDTNPRFLFLQKLLSSTLESEAVSETNSPGDCWFRKRWGGVANT